MAKNCAQADTSARIFLPSLSLWRSRRVRRILELAGYHSVVGRPDVVAQWGTGKTSGRAQWLSRRTKRTIVWIEDAFLRSMLPGRAGDPPIGLIIDRDGLYYDSSSPSGLEKLLADHPLDDEALLKRAREAITLQISLDVSKYSAHADPLPDNLGEYVVVADQAFGDHAVTLGGGDQGTFDAMLAAARVEHPGSKIVIKVHPETVAGYRRGYLDEFVGQDDVVVLRDSVSPWVLLERARAVYTVTSQLGYEAILSGHRPVVFGQPFYSGWGLSDDRMPIARRKRSLRTDQLYAAATLLYPTWYDPYDDTLGTAETAILTLGAEARAWREDRSGAVACGMRLWKRRHLRRFFADGPLRFETDPEKATGMASERSQALMCWSKPSSEIKQKAVESGVRLLRTEDGFLRSRGLGAELVPPLSLVRDETGIHFDPTQPSDLENLIRQSTGLPPNALERARQLRHRLIELGLTKYNVGSVQPIQVPTNRKTILVTGQVEDDASVIWGAAEPNTTNQALLSAARKAHPRGFLIYKPHPDVEAGLRDGEIVASDADIVARNTNPSALVELADEIWTITSLLGFEGLIRDVDVVCAGRPFYSGWGLTSDLPCTLDEALGTRRSGARPTLDGLTHAALIDYPRYFDPETGRACPVEVAVKRLASGDIPKTGHGLRLLSKLQGLLASHSPVWR